MTDATEVPGAETRRLIEEALAAAEPAEHELDRYIEAALRAVAAFDAEVDPLGLRDMPYERIVTDSRLRVVLGIGRRMEAKLGKLTERAA